MWKLGFDAKCHFIAKGVVVMCDTNADRADKSSAAMNRDLGY